MADRIAAIAGAVIFTTGVAHVPPLGFDKALKIQFMGEQRLLRLQPAHFHSSFPVTSPVTIPLRKRSL